MTSHQLAMQLLKMPDVKVLIPKINSFQELEFLKGVHETTTQGSNGICDCVSLHNLNIGSI